MGDERSVQADTVHSVVKEMHGAFLEALRQREQEIFSYLTTLSLAFGGFGWLLVQQYSKEPPTTKIPFIFGTMGVLLLLFLGALYAAALGYNYRYVTFQLAKIEDSLEINDVILSGWPRTVQEFKRYTRWCDPPELIKVFWVSFMGGILFVTSFAAYVTEMPIRIWLLGGALFGASVLSPRYFGYRFGRLWRSEPRPEHPSEIQKTSVNK